MQKSTMVVVIVTSLIYGGRYFSKQRDVMGNREVALRARAPRSLARLRVRRSRDYLVSHA